ncbi:MAG TPA: ABC transporter transmembrane domain-containing protein, partial [Alphaproteobacteria bacterium]|nr:ABC transporter transmembrane domain-containing protein [Alphaproteobacteria bacterium]
MTRLLRGYIRKHYGKLGIAAVCMALVAAATATNAWMMEPVLDEVFLNQNRTMLVIVPLAVLAVAIIKGIASYFQAYLMSVVGQRIIAEIQIELFAHLMKADLAYFNNTATGRL